VNVRAIVLQQMPDIPFSFNKDICFFGTTNYRSQKVRFGIKTDDRRRHMYVIGKTGMGKSTLLENMFLQDIWNGHGCCYIDPHGDTVEKFLKVVPSHRINDVVYFNPSDLEWPIAFNFFDQVEPQYRHLVASGLVGAFKKIWADSWGPRLEYFLRNAIITLLDYPGSTILGVNKLFTDKEFRKKVVERLSDPVVRSFWIDEFAKFDPKGIQDVLSPIQNKVGQFLSSSLIRNMVAQTRTAFSLRDIMDERKIFLVNLSKGRIGEDSSALLGAVMITKLQMAAMSRVDMQESERKDFFLYVDEFQNFATDSFANILSEARKYRLNLIIAHQYIDQLGDVVRSAVFGNVGTICIFRVGASDADFLEREFQPRFTKEDIINLPKWKAYLRLMIDGIASDPFSADLLPPISVPTDMGSAEKVIRVNRERYCQARGVVEEKINRFSGGDRDVVTATLDTATSSRRSRENENVSKGVLSYSTQDLNKNITLEKVLQFTEVNIQIQDEVQNNIEIKNKSNPVIISESQKVNASNLEKNNLITKEEAHTSSNLPQEKKVREDSAQEEINLPQENSPLQEILEEKSTKKKQEKILTLDSKNGPSLASSIAPKKNVTNIQLPSLQFSSQNIDSKTLKKAARGKVLNTKPLTREMYSTSCGRCNITTQVPFQPDGKRPVYCKDCLSIVRSQLAKSQSQASSQVTPISLAAALGTTPDPVIISEIEESESYETKN